MKTTAFTALVVLLLAACGLPESEQAVQPDGAPTSLGPAVAEVPLSSLPVELTLDTVDLHTEVFARIAQPTEGPCVTLDPSSRLVVAGQVMALTEPGQGRWVYSEAQGINVFSNSQSTKGGWVLSCTPPTFSGSFTQPIAQALTISAGERTWQLNEGQAHFEVVGGGQHQLEVAWVGAQLPQTWQVGFLRAGKGLGEAEGGLDCSITRSATALSVLVTVPPALWGVEGSVQLMNEQLVSPDPGLKVSMHTFTHFAVQ